ncbi:MAG: hypothetical protein HY784_11845 [Chloroflexi bacterium]|nr:hypothetical protein [Chloroflexota bacterium]
MSDPTNPGEMVKTVCGGDMTLTPALPRAEYRGRTVYFCHRGCLRAFQGAPDRFMADEIPHPDPEPAAGC